MDSNYSNHIFQSNSNIIFHDILSIYLSDEIFEDDIYAGIPIISSTRNKSILHKMIRNEIYRILEEREIIL